MEQAIKLHQAFIACYEEVMTITVREIVGLPDLRTWVFAGEGGLDREVAWAHVSEMPDPTQWLEAGDLVMTTGLGVPEGSASQRAYVERLTQAGMSGLMIGHRMRAPELTEGMAAAADECSLPVLLTSYEVPFAAVSRVVSEANRGEEQRRLLEVLRLYETVRAEAAGASGPELLTRLGRLVGCGLHVVDPGSGLSLLPGVPAPPEDLVGALGAELSGRHDPMPAVLRLGPGGRTAMAVAVPASRPAAMIVSAGGAVAPDLSVLRHMAAVLALEVEKESAEREKRRRLGAELLAGLMDGRLPAEVVAQSLAERGLGEEPRVLAVCTVEGGKAEHSDLHLRLEDRGVPHLLLRRAPLLFALLPDKDRAPELFRRVVDSRASVGLSAPLGRLTRVPEAQREARWALEDVRDSPGALSRYGEAATSFFSPRDLGEAERAARHFLGPLVDYDAAHGTELVASLRAFLAHNRSWRKTSAEIHVHTQTLVYRMRRVEELSGKKLTQTGDVAELWFALRSAEACGLLQPAP